MGLRDVGQMRQKIILGVTTGFSSSQLQQAQLATSPGFADLSFMVHPTEGISFDA